MKSLYDKKISKNREKNVKKVFITKALLFTIVFFVTTFTSCMPLDQRDVVSEDALQRAINAGIIAQTDAYGGENIRRNLAEVQVADIVAMGRRISVVFDLSQIRELGFDRDEVRLVEIYVSANQMVSKGEVLAVAEFDTREIETEIGILSLAIEREEQGFERDRAQHINNLNDMRRELNQVEDDYEWQTGNYRIQRQELIYQRFLAQHENRIDNYRSQLAELSELLEGEKIRAPFDGVIISVEDTNIGNIVRSFNTIIGIVNPEQFQFITSGPINFIRYGDVFPAVIHPHDFEFDLQVVSDPIVTDTREDVYTFVIQPVDLDAFWDGFFALGVEYSYLRRLRIDAYPINHEVHNVLTIPITALNEHDDYYYVLLYESGELKIRFVDVGLRDDEYVQILSGLKEGQFVVR